MDPLKRRCARGRLPTPNWGNVFPQTPFPFYDLGKRAGISSPGTEEGAPVGADEGLEPD